MMTDLAPDLLVTAPEIFVAVMGMIMLMYGVYAKGDTLRAVSRYGIATLLVAAVLVTQTPVGPVTAFSGMFVADSFAGVMKLLAIIGSALSVLLSVSFLQREGIDRFEYPVLIVFSTLGMMMMISANDLIALYMGLELQSLPLYVLAAIHRENGRASEAGVKYFVLGALSSGMLLYGLSMIYGFAGTTNFETLAYTFGQMEAVPPGLVTGMVFVIAAMAFKLSAVPFHMWTPDVYEGAPTPVTAFFAIAPKVAAIALFVRLFAGVFGELIDQWQQVIILISVASMAIGAFGAIAQNNIKRLMAYSSIGHMGYALIGLAAGSVIGVRGVIVYMAIYMLMSAGTFAVILCMRRQGVMLEKIDDLAGLSRNHPMLALAMGIMMFSMSGIPPLAGFFGKLFVFQAAVEAGLYTLAVLGVLTSVVAAFYYLRIVKVMYFDAPADRFDLPVGRDLGTVIWGTSLFVVLFIVFPSPLMDYAQSAAVLLLPG